MNDISRKNAIVTGAASGIGLGIATALAEAGANVVMADIQKDLVEQAAHGLSGTNKRVLPLRIDVTQEQSVLDALAEAERNFGKLAHRLQTMPACRCMAPGWSTCRRRTGSL
jgi:NAD(P)-dependent dehydrogenase (short-subunit alcohol dehydrogenase family)